MGNYVFEHFSDDSKRLINQAGVRQKMPEKEGNEYLNACWDGFAAPDGTFYFPLSSESGMCGTTKLARYDYDSNSVIECFDAAKVLMPRERALPHSKFHTSLNAIPRHALYPEAANDPMDYLIIGTTHSTDRAKHHPEWMPFGHHNHIWEGFPGSQLLVYDPKSGHAMTLGTPVLHETIYGAKYDPKYNRIYLIGFMRGHVYCYDLAKRNVIKDLGKAAEVFTYRLSLGSDGHIYGCSKSGQLFRINTDTVTLENLDFHVPDFKDNYMSYTWYRYLVVGRNHASGKYMYLAFAATDQMYRLEFETGNVTPLGSCIPGDGLYELPAKDGCWYIHGFDIDKDGVLWLAVGEESIHNDTPYTSPHGTYLIRWDVDRGEKPFCCGLIGTPERILEYVSEMEYDHVRDILYWVNTATERAFGLDRPTAGGVDLKQFRKTYQQRGPVSTDDFLQQRRLSEEELEARQKKVEQRGGEENAVSNPFQAFDPRCLDAVRIWRSFPRLSVEESKVIGMAFDPAPRRAGYLLHVVCGSGGTFDTASYVLQVTDGAVSAMTPMAKIPSAYRQWLRESILPQPPQLSEEIHLPEATGRRYRAKASCVVPWKDGKKFVGTMDALAAIVSPDGSVFSLGNAAAYGPVRSMVTDQAKEHLWGVAGDDEDLGYVFAYDDVSGLRQLGILNYNMYGFFDGPTAANVLSSIALSPDEKFLAIGSADRIATVHVAKIK